VGGTQLRAPAHAFGAGGDGTLSRACIAPCRKKGLIGMPSSRSVAVLGLAALLLAAPGSMHRAYAVGEIAGPVTGLPVPRYVSLKNDRVNLREGPSKEHRTSWVFQRAGLPVEITAEFETWRRIRDSEGAEGWVLHSLLSGRRTALVMPWSKKPDESIALLERADERSALVARLAPNVLANVRSCAGSWCRVTVNDHEGFIRQDRLWGVYPNERIN
jgi:SH3-like domain-containing protein